MKIAIRVLETRKARTYPHKEELKALGCVWWKDSPVKNGWVWFGDTENGEYEEVAQKIVEMGFIPYPYFGTEKEECRLERELGRNGVYYCALKKLSSLEVSEAKEVYRRFCEKGWI